MILIDDFEEEVKKQIPIVYKVKKERYKFVPMGFDIETYTEYEKDETGQVVSHFTSMYIWQLSMNDSVFIGRTWKEFGYLLTLIKKHLCDKPFKTIMFIHNASFEFSFMGRELTALGHKVEVFARKPRKPMKTIIDDSIIILDSYLLTGYSLEKLAKNYTNTQKLKGDLDYSIPRHSSTPIYSDILNEKEMNYCYNDVLILSEWAIIYADTYLKKGVMPMTKTMVANYVVREKIKELKASKEVFYLMNEAYPKSREMYDYIMSFYTGAYTHGMLPNLFHTWGRSLAYDVTSEYPYTMMFCYMPMGKFKILNLDIYRDKVDYFLENYCCLVECTLTNVKSMTGVTIISKNKHYGAINPIWDNGRLYSADEIKLRLTEIDLITLSKHMKFDIEYNSIMYCKRGYLPKYFRLAIADLYATKSRLKFNKEMRMEYEESKRRLNAMYGACACREQETEVVFDDGWKIVENERDFSRVWKSKNKLPQWACWITAHSRALILEAVYNIICPSGTWEKQKRDNYYYSDTDSVKCSNEKYIIDMFDNFNKKIRKQNDVIVEELGLKEKYSDVDFAEMGTFLLEHDDITRFKTLGSKRYITEYSDGTIETTIAGLPKKAFIEYCKKRNLDPFEAFTEKGIMIADNESMKLCAYYNDKGDIRTITDALGNSCEIETKSYVSLIPTTFNLKVTSELQQLNLEITKLAMLERNLKNGN